MFRFLRWTFYIPLLTLIRLWPIWCLLVSDPVMIISGDSSAVSFGNLGLAGVGSGLCVIEVSTHSLVNSLPRQIMKLYYVLSPISLLSTQYFLHECFTKMNRIIWYYGLWLWSEKGSSRYDDVTLKIQGMSSSERGVWGPQRRLIYTR